MASASPSFTSLSITLARASISSGVIAPRIIPHLAHCALPVPAPDAPLARLGAFPLRPTRHSRFTGGRLAFVCQERSKVVLELSGGGNQQNAPSTNPTRSEEHTSELQ